MKTALTILGRLALVMTILPAFLYLFDVISFSALKDLMFAATLVWFVCSPMLQKIHEQKAKEEN
ncbi:hypothetical protein PQO01_10005 [Lentisphaera marina]|uniref:hypothetical protein n=1 Tax=Lentisphaera marina TaxID=1111041 RepID=UPI002365B8BA|nr:hypothetical protein [Lentisphaera marina]MDD7985285.1 hypothetical protein [Lentisphaera marina]